MRTIIAYSFCLVIAPAILAGEPQINGTPSGLGVDQNSSSRLHLLG